MRIKNGRDFWAGLMFAGFGLAFMLTAFSYRMGSALRMGPAYFPAVRGGLLALLAVFITESISGALLGLAIALLLVTLAPAVRKTRAIAFRE
ncbi:MAG: hypothetical protein AAB150_17485 [Pseudomonadota bacterium]